ncbi:MAG: glycosyltransferase family 2 protein [Bacteroidales bacterium]
MSQLKTAVVILNWNGRKFLEQFLPNLMACTGEAATLIVADNHSSDDSVSFMQKQYPQIQLIQNNENGGFAKGYNDALAQLDAQYYVLLNSDIEVTPHWIEPIIEMMDKDPQIACCQPKLRSFHKRNFFEYAGAAGGFIDYLGYPFCRGRIFESIEEDLGQYDEVCEVFWATGAALFVRADLYQQYGGLDADFFAHQEEIDFCWRMKNLGYKNMYCPQSVVYHIGGGTLPKSSAHKTYLNFRNNLSLLYKNLPQKELKKVFLYRFILDLIATLRFLCKGSFAEVKAVFRAYIDFYKIKEHNKAKRAQFVQKDDLSCMWQRSLVWNYYIRKIRTFKQIHFPF